MTQNHSKSLSILFTEKQMASIVDLGLITDEFNSLSDIVASLTIVTIRLDIYHIIFIYYSRGWKCNNLKKKIPTLKYF